MNFGIYCKFCHAQFAPFEAVFAPAYSWSIIYFQLSVCLSVCLSTQIIQNCPPNTPKLPKIIHYDNFKKHFGPKANNVDTFWAKGQEKQYNCDILNYYYW